MLSYYRENGQYYTMSVSMTTNLGSIDETKTQHSTFFLMLEKNERIGRVVSRNGNVILFFTNIRGRLPRVNDE